MQTFLAVHPTIWFTKPSYPSRSPVTPCGFFLALFFTHHAAQCRQPPKFSFSLSPLRRVPWPRQTKLSFGYAIFLEIFAPVCFSQGSFLSLTYQNLLTDGLRNHFSPYSLSFNWGVTELPSMYYGIFYGVFSSAGGFARATFATPFFLLNFLLRPPHFRFFYIRLRFLPLLPL